MLPSDKTSVFLQIMIKMSLTYSNFKCVSKRPLSKKCGCISELCGRTSEYADNKRENERLKRAANKTQHSHRICGVKSQVLSFEA